MVFKKINYEFNYELNVFYGKTSLEDMKVNMKYVMGSEKKLELIENDG